MAIKFTPRQRRLINRFLEEGKDLNYIFVCMKDDDRSLLEQKGDPWAQFKKAVIAFLKKGKKFPSQTLAANLIPKRWEIVRDVTPSKFQVKNLEAVSFLRDSGSYDEGYSEHTVRGVEMRKRAVWLKANLGLADAKNILKDQAEIPIPNFRNHDLLFPGTLLCNTDGDFCIACLHYQRTRWRPRFKLVGGYFYNDTCLVSSH